MILLPIIENGYNGKWLVKTPQAKFPGNPTRSYRTEAPLKIVGEVDDWVKQTPEEIQKWREKLANNNREISN